MITESDTFICYKLTKSEGENGESVIDFGVLWLLCCGGGSVRKSFQKEVKLLF